MKKVLILLFGLLAIIGCKDDDDKAKPATDDQMKEVTGHWFAEVPLSGETENWRTEEEGDMKTYDKIDAIIYLNGASPDACYWGYLYMQNGDMVNYDGIGRRDQEANFEFKMDQKGYITTSSHLPDAPKVTNMHYTGSVITADVAYKGKSFSLTFTRPTSDQETLLSDFWQILAEEGIIGGYGDEGDKQNTDVRDNDATEPSRSNATIFMN